MSTENQKHAFPDKLGVAQGNELIALFMGMFPQRGWGGYYSMSLNHNTSRCKTAEETLKGFGDIASYHEKWDWLMPVVEKIETINDGIYQFNILQEGCFITRNCKYIGVDVDRRINYLADAYTKIRSAWMAAVSFIEWYNKNEIVYTTECGTGYTLNDVVSIARGNRIYAHLLIDRAEWQHIETIIEEDIMEEEIIETESTYLLNH